VTWKQAMTTAAKIESATAFWVARSHQSRLKKTSCVSVAKPGCYLKPIMKWRKCYFGQAEYRNRRQYVNVIWCAAAPQVRVGACPNVRSRPKISPTPIQIARTDVLMCPFIHAFWWSARVCSHSKIKT
jgi:hypothetical protein